MPKTPDKTQQLMNESPEPHAVITVGNEKSTALEKKDREEANKPLYLRRV